MTPFPLALVLAAVWLLALAWRWPLAAELNLGSDGLGQWSAALALLHGGAPVPPNPEGGHSLWLFGLPPVLLGGSLEGAAQVRVAMGALVAPLGGLAAGLCAEAGPGRLAAAALAGTMLAVDPGLLDTLLIAFRGYGAPELVALATVGLALHLRQPAGPGAALAAAALVGAAGQHPMAGGCLAGALAGALVGLARSSAGPQRRALGAAVGLGALLLLPRAAWLWRLAQCGQGALACLGTVASGSSEPGLGPADFLVRAVHDRFWVDIPGGWLAPLLLALAAGAALLPGGPRRARGAAAWALLTGIGLVLLGLAVASLRPYHLRVLAAPMAVLVALGAARHWPVAAAAALVLPLLLPRPTPPASDGGPAATDARARALWAAVAEAPAVRVDAAWYGDPVGVEPGPTVLSMVLQGAPADRLQAREDAVTILLVNTDGGLPAPPAPPLLRWSEGYALRFPTVAAAQAWVRSTAPPPVVEGGAFDWVKAIHPDDPRQTAVSW